MLHFRGFRQQLIFSTLLVGAAAQAKNYVVITGDEEVLKAVQKGGGHVQKKLRYHRAFVVEMSEANATKIQERFSHSARVEEDGLAQTQPVHIAGKRPPSPPPAQSTPWGIGAVKAPQAWATTRGAGVLVCIVDTGIQRDHSDLSSNVFSGENFVIKKGVLNPLAWDDDEGHGSHVAGTVAALDNLIGVVGVAPQAKLFAAKVLNQRGSGSLSDVAEGVRSCIANGAQVINMSLGSPSDGTLLREAVADAIAAGITVVAAAGNESTRVSYPAAYPGVLAISAIDAQFKLAYFSNTGPEISFAAPGVSVLSTTKGNAYASYSGTSMASPHVAGVAALRIAAGTSNMLADILPVLSPEQQGAGLINALLTVLTP
jgi:subtilisin